LKTQIRTIQPTRRKPKPAGYRKFRLDDPKVDFAKLKAKYKFRPEKGLPYGYHLPRPPKGNPPPADAK
jgi:hypothetical protein